MERMYRQDVNSLLNELRHVVPSCQQMLILGQQINKGVVLAKTVEFIVMKQQKSKHDSGVNQSTHGSATPKTLRHAGEQDLAKKLEQLQQESRAMETTIRRLRTMKDEEKSQLKAGHNCPIGDILNYE